MRPPLLLMLLSVAVILAGCNDNARPEKAIDFKLVPLEDQAKSVTLADFKGKTILVDFWATYCGPCRDAMPELQALWTKYRAKGLEIVSASAEDRETILNFHAKQRYNYPVYVDRDGAMALEYGVQGLPTFLIIRGGKIVFKQEGYAPDHALTKTINEMLR